MLKNLKLNQQVIALKKKKKNKLNKNYKVLVLHKLMIPKIVKEIVMLKAKKMKKKKTTMKKMLPHLVLIPMKKNKKNKKQKKNLLTMLLKVQVIKIMIINLKVLTTKNQYPKLIMHGQNNLILYQIKSVKKMNTLVHMNLKI